MIDLLFAAASTAALFQPTSKWLVNFDDSQCVAQREYGTAEKPLTLMLKTPVSGDVVQLALVVDDTGSAEARQIYGRVAWGSGKGLVTTILTYRGGRANRRLYLVNLPKAQVIEAAASDRLTVSAGKDLQHSFVLSNLATVIGTMDKCVSDLGSYWNYVERSPDAPPAPDDPKPEQQFASLFTTEDYPMQAIEENGSGIVSAILLIDADGRVADCTLTKTSGVAALDSQTCAVFKTRARYQPAKGPDGRPRRSFNKVRVRWELPL